MINSQSAKLSAAFPINTPSQQSNSQESALDCLFQAINGLTQAIALFRADGTLVYWNSAAQVRIREFNGMFVDGVPGADWIRELRTCVDDKAVGLFEFALHNQTHYIAMMPIAAGTETLVMADFGSQTASVPQAMRHFSKRHGLTNMEHEVLEKLSRGLKPAAIASSHNVSICTINTQLRAIRSKTGCASATALVIKLARLPILGAIHMGNGVYGRSANMAR